MSSTRRTFPIGGMAVALLLAFGATAHAGAQEMPDSARLTQFAQAHIQINDARDEFHGEIARVHDAEGRLRAREEVDARIAEILEANEMTQQEYDDFILLISLDGELRDAFEATLTRLAEETSN